MRQDRIVERPALLLVRAHDGGRIRHTPVSDDRLARKEGASLLRAIADGDHKVPVLLWQSVEATGSSTGPEVAVPF